MVLEAREVRALPPRGVPNAPQGQASGARLSRRASSRRGRQASSCVWDLDGGGKKGYASPVTRARATGVTGWSGGVLACGKPRGHQMRSRLTRTAWANAPGEPPLSAQNLWPPVGQTGAIQRPPDRRIGSGDAGNPVSPGIPLCLTRPSVRDRMPARSQL